MNYINEILAADFVDPWAFWLFIPAACFCIMPAVLRRRGLFVSLLRLISLSLIIAALADPVKESSKERQEFAALIDLSYSMPPAAERALLEKFLPYVRSQKDATATLFAFGKNLGRRTFTVKGNENASALAEQIAADSTDVDTGESNIAAGLSGVMSRSESASLLLLSDGQENSGNAIQLAQAAGQRGMRIFPLIPENDVFKKERLTLSSLFAPVTASAGDTIEVRSTVANGYRQEQRGKLELWMDEEKLFSQQISIPAGQEKLITVKAPANKGGLHRLRAVLVPEEAAADAESKAPELHRWVSVKEKAKILLVSGDKDDERVLRQLITQKGYNLQNVIADGSTEIPENFDNISGVIINNVAKRQLPQKFLPALESYVKSGGGLLLVGGDRSFGLGGYIDSKLEEMSPLKFLPPQTEKRRLNNAIVLVIDKSGSMAEDNKIEAAKSAALASIQALKDEDFISVIGFDAGPFVIINVMRVAEAKAQAQSRLRNLTAAGKTNLLPALATARQLLQKAGASRKHIIVLSDGKFPLTSDAYISEINNLRAEGISVSCVALGLDADVPFMKILSKYGKGAFYHTLDASQLPSIFVEDIKVSSGEKTLQEGIDMPVGVGPAGVTSTTIENYPPIRGFVETLPKKGSELELITRKEDRVFPMLASWQYGSGKVIAFTSDANGRWSAPWIPWREFVNFWNDMLENIKDKSGAKSGDVDFDLRYSVDRKAVVLDLAIYDDKLRTESAPRITAEVTEPGNEQKKLSFQMTHRGRFEARIENGRPGDYKLQLNYGSTKLPDLEVTLGGDLFGEIRGAGLNVPLLENLAYLTGGKINPKPEEIQGRERVTRNKEHLFLPLLIAAFVLVMLEAFIRERGAAFFLGFVGIKRKSAQAKTQTGIYSSRKPKRGSDSSGESKAA